MRRIIFKKSYTRDNCFIIQEIWDKAYTEDYFGNRNPYFPPQINYLNGGVVEIWENKRAIKWFADQLLMKNFESKNFLNHAIKEHIEILKELKKFYKRKRLKSIKELKKFIGLLEQGTKTFLAIYYSATDKRTPTKINEKAMKIRKEDTFYDNIDIIIRNTIEQVYPWCKGLSVSLLKEELETPPSMDSLLKRFKNCIMVINEKLQITNLKKFVKKNKKYDLKFDKLPRSNILKGQTAYIGHAIGKAKIIKQKAQIKDLKNGEILISPMTTPDYIPAIKKAKAIITDEGGITCHASIVSRELKKPCIVGTRVASKFFKNGEIVEIDANKGIAKKLGKNYLL